MKRTYKSVVTLVAGLVVFSLGAAAQAQDPAPTEPPPSSPPPAVHRSSGGGGGGAGIGVGASQFLSFGGPGIAVGQFVYDQSIWHIEGFLGFASVPVGGGDDRATTIVFGAGGWYHLHSGASSDFSLGGLIGVATTSGPGASTTVTSFEPGALVRAFLTPNVAAHARVGLAVDFGDTGSGGTEVYLQGQVVGAFGFTYFFR